MSQIWNSVKHRISQEGRKRDRQNIECHGKDASQIADRYDEGVSR